MLNPDYALENLLQLESAAKYIKCHILWYFQGSS